MAFIYLLTNAKNGKRYVGKTCRSLDVRWKGHLGSARRGDTDMLVCRAIKKHGPESFKREVIDECDETLLGAREMHWIYELKTHVSQGGYNLTYGGGGGGTLGHKRSEASKEKSRQSALKRAKPSSEVIERTASKLRGRPQSVEAVEKRASANRGKKRTAEQKARMKAGQLASPKRFKSKEVRAKISLAGIGRVTSEATKEKFFKAVEQFTVDGTVVRTFKSLTEAAQFAGLSKGAMSGVVRNSKRLVSGYHWRYRSGAKIGNF